jgi:hypothetical protein
VVGHDRLGKKHCNRLKNAFVARQELILMRYRLLRKSSRIECLCGKYHDIVE